MPSTLPPSRRLQRRLLTAALLSAMSVPAFAGTHCQLIDDAGNPVPMALAAVQAALRGNDLATARLWLARMPADIPPASAVSWQLARGLVAQRDRDRDHALQEIERLAGTLGTDSPDERIRIAVALGLMRLDRDEPQQAAAVLGELDAYADGDYRVAWSTMTLYRMLGDAAQAERARAQAEALRGERKLATPLVL